MKKYQVEQSKKTSFTATEGHKYYCDDISIGLSYLSFPKDIYTFGEDCGITQLITIYEVIY